MRNEKRPLPPPSLSRLLGIVGGIAACASYAVPIRWDREMVNGVRIGSYPLSELHPRRPDMGFLVDGCLTQFRKRMVPREVPQHTALLDAQKALIRDQVVKHLAENGNAQVQLVADHVESFDFSGRNNRFYFLTCHYDDVTYYCRRESQSCEVRISPRR
jgi:hypothetical protein